MRKIYFLNLSGIENLESNIYNLFLIFILVIPTPLLTMAVWHKKIGEQASKVTSKVKKKKVQKKTNYPSRFNYSEETLINAIKCAREKKHSIKKISEEFGVPRTTLNKKLKQNNPLIRKMGPATYLRDLEEQRIAKWILDKAQIGYPMHHNIVKSSIKKVLDDAKHKTSFKDNLTGRKWMKLFLKRFLKIKKKHTEILSKSRASVTEEMIREWFAEVHQYLKSVDALYILNDPTRIYNLDETGVHLYPKTGIVLGPEGEKNCYEISPGQEKVNITVLYTYSAAGVSIRPIIVYPYQRMPAELRDSVPEGYVV